MKILCVDHTSAVSGAEHSLLELVRGLRALDDVRVACPADGPLADAVRGIDVPVDAIPGTAGSLKLTATETPRAVVRLGLAAALTARHAWRMSADVIHANSIRAGMFSVVASRLTGIPAVVHVRDRLPRSTAADASLRLIASGARAVVANSRYTADGVNAVCPSTPVSVVHNPVDLERFHPRRADRAAVRHELGLAEHAFALAVVGQITPWKGQREAVEVVDHLTRAGRDVQLLLVGEAKFVSRATRYDNRTYVAELQALIASQRLQARVRLLGERRDVPQLMAGLDALLVPSWEEPFGRVVVEGMAMGVPVLATAIGGPAEIIDDGIDGLLLEPRDPAGWAGAVQRLMDEPRLAGRLAAAGRERARAFTTVAHVTAMREHYERVRVAGPGPRR